MVHVWFYIFDFGEFCNINNLEKSFRWTFLKRNENVVMLKYWSFVNLYRNASTSFINSKRVNVFIFPYITEKGV